jgi:hypothetical protein
MDGEDGEEGGGQLEEDLHPLVMGLIRSGRMSAAMCSFRDAAAGETKRGIRVVVEQLLPTLLADQVRNNLRAPALLSPHTHSNLSNFPPQIIKQKHGIK